MRVVVDWDACESHGQCEFAAPEIFSINDDGDLEILNETPPESERSNVEQAVRRCPTRALSLSETDETTTEGDSEFLVLHALKVRGLGDAETLSDISGLPVGTVTSVLAETAERGHSKQRQGRISGHTLTPDGRARHALLCHGKIPQEEIDAISREYEKFLTRNRTFKQLTTDWQTGTASGDTNEITSRLETLHSEVTNIIETIATVQPRFLTYRNRFDIAFEAFRGGNGNALSKPMTGSYHDIWMELHEDLLTTCNRKRSNEDE